MYKVSELAVVEGGNYKIKPWTNLLLISIINIIDFGK